MRRLAWVIVSMLAAAGAMGADELPLPAVPAEMTVPADRAGYILLHFWDAMDFDDAGRSLDLSARHPHRRGPALPAPAGPGPPAR